MRPIVKLTEFKSSNMMTKINDNPKMEEFFQILPLDINVSIVSYFSFSAVFSLAKYNPLFNQLILNDKFWDLYYFNRFGYQFNSPSNKQKSDPDVMKEFLSARDFITYVNEQYQHLMDIEFYYRGMKLMARYGFGTEMMDFRAKYKTQRENRNEEAKRNLTRSQFKYLEITGGCSESYNDVIWEIVKNGHRKNFEILIGDPEDYMAENDYDRNICYNTPLVLYRIAEWYDMNIMELFLNKGGSQHDQIYGSILVIAIEKGNKEIIDLIMRKNYNIDYAVISAVEKRDVVLIESLLQNIHQNHILSLQHKIFIYNDAMMSAVVKGNVDTVKIFLEKGATKCNEAMIAAAKHGYIEIVKIMLEKGATKCNETMIAAAVHGNIEIIKIMLERGENKYNEVMTSTEDIEIVKLPLT